jgi:acyl-CoA synthetase (AMP-forming)/AMP-acid ligase II
MDISTVFFVGAEPVRNTTIDNFVDAFKGCGANKNNILPGYGLAESVLVVSLVGEESNVSERE